ALLMRLQHGGVCHLRSIGQPQHGFVVLGGSELVRQRATAMPLDQRGDLDQALIPLGMSELDLSKVLLAKTAVRKRGHKPAPCAYPRGPDAPTLERKSTASAPDGNTDKPGVGRPHLRAQPGESGDGASRRRSRVVKKRAPSGQSYKSSR